VAEKAPKLEEYTVTIEGVEHTMLLSPEDAERFQASKAKKAPANKSRTPEDK
jgi:hypothetical protein